MMKSPVLYSFAEWETFKNGVENSHVMMHTKPGKKARVFHIDTFPLVFPCIAFSATTFQNQKVLVGRKHPETVFPGEGAEIYEHHIHMGYMFAYPEDFTLAEQMREDK